MKSDDRKSADFQQIAQTYKMSINLLVRRDKINVPSMIVRESSKISDAINTFHENNVYQSKDVTRLMTFSDLDYIVRDGEMADRLTLRESQMVFKNATVVELSFRISILMFLAQTYDYSMPGTIIIASRHQSHIVDKLRNFVKMLYPSAKIVIPDAIELSTIYDQYKNSSVIASGLGHTVQDIHHDIRNKHDGIVYLISLEKSVHKHSNLVEHYKPLHALFNIEVYQNVDFMFYPGNMWIPPFCNGENAMFLRSDFSVKNDSPWQSWNSDILRAVMMRYYRNTRKNVTYINPFTGSDEFLFDKYENDFSHLFALHALVLYYKKLKTQLLPEMLTDEAIGKTYALILEN